jgi:hypothetical protein
LKISRWIAALAFFSLAVCASPIGAQAPPSDKKAIWKSVEFAIVKFNDEAPKAWNIYHTERKGLLLIHLWKRYLLLDVKEQEVYEINPQTVKAHGEDVEWSLADKPEQPLETPDWKTKDLRSMEMVKFRLGKDGHFLELQLPLQVNGKPVY